MVNNMFLGFILTVILGIVSGIFGGGLGLGISTLALPGFLILGLAPNIKTSIGTTLVSSPASWAAVYKYYKAGNVELIRGIIYTICYIIGTHYGASINMMLSSKTISYSLSGVYFLVGTFFLYQGMK